MRTQAPWDPPADFHSEDDDDTLTRTRAALHAALEELDLPPGISDEETARLVRRPDSF